jgi:hypothetical protein
MVRRAGSSCRDFVWNQVTFTKLANGEWKVTMNQKQFAGTIKNRFYQSSIHLCGRMRGIEIP